MLRFTAAMLEDPDLFEKVYGVLMQGSMDEIDRAEMGPGRPLVLNQTSAVSIRADGDGVVGELLHVDGGDPVKRSVVSRFRRR